MSVTSAPCCLPTTRPHLAPLDDTALADSIRRLLLSLDASRAIGAANRAKAEQEFDQQRMFRTYRAFFDGAEPPPADMRSTSARAPK